MRKCHILYMCNKKFTPYPWSSTTTHNGDERRLAKVANSQPNMNVKLSTFLLGSSFYFHFINLFLEKKKKFFFFNFDIIIFFMFGRVTESVYMAQKSFSSIAT